MQTIYAVLQQQGRVALLPDAKISAILDQVSVMIRYNPLECKAINPNPMAMFAPGAMHPHCIVIGNVVTGLCLMAQPGIAMCDLSTSMLIGAIDDTHKSISRTLPTTNVIMAHWSRKMWQSVLNRAIQILGSGQLRLYFYTAFATVT
ncbi:hypothetical protein KIN20_026748 [Parelaphostrongylus tenuis]|uniref:Uncharacterized protein n=1 Tax=Parelaphostrongylus tenuis TaxID=148309 RepID=A0AAD5QYD6_PARTN|nr:hypothetical protein KIN20_026748 [Parelaphostrongylus tenuis]